MIKRHYDADAQGLNDSGAAGTQESQTIEANTEPVDTQVGERFDVKAYFNTNEGKTEIMKLVQSDIDRERTKAIKTWQENNLEKYVSKEVFDELKNQTTQEITKYQKEKAVLKAFEDVPASVRDLIIDKVNYNNINLTENGIVGVNEEVAKLKENFKDIIQAMATPKVVENNIVTTQTPKKQVGTPEPELSIEKINNMTQAELMKNMDKIDAFLANYKK